MKKRSLKIAGHATSISLEEEFWDALKDLAEKNGVSVPTLVADIDRRRGTQNLSAAIRVHILKTLQKK